MKNKQTSYALFAGIILGAVASMSFYPSLLHAQEGSTSGAAPAKRNLAMSPTDKAAYFSHGDMETVWKELEATQTNNHRILGGQNHVVYIRIVKPGSPPIVHTAGADVWVVEAGSAVAVTGGTLVNPKPAVGKDPNSIFGDTVGTSIEGGTEQLMTAGDILFVPPGVPHNFEKMKGFRAYLIRFEAK